MEDTYWHKQTKGAPLYPDMLWSRPENRAHAGKLLIAGGTAHGFAAPALAYTETVAAGVGTSRVLLPDAIKEVARHALETVEFAPSTPSGSFSRKALAEFIDHGLWADAVLLAGDFGRNSETAIVIETFLQKYSGLTIITHDAVDYLYAPAKLVIARDKTSLVLTIAQLQKLAKAIGYPHAVTFAMGILQLVAWLHEFTLLYPITIVTKHLDIIYVAHKGFVTTTKLLNGLKIWRVSTAGYVSVWQLQNPNKQLESATTAVVESLH